MSLHLPTFLIQYFLDYPAAAGQNLFNGCRIIHKDRLNRITLFDIGTQDNANSWSETTFEAHSSIVLGRLRSQVKQLSNIFMPDACKDRHLSTYLISLI